MKILFSTYGIIDKEGFQRNFPLAKGLASLGNNVTLLSTQSGGFIFPFKLENRSNVLLISFPDIFPHKIRKNGLSPFNTLLRIIYILNKDYDVVHSDGHMPASFCHVL